LKKKQLKKQHYQSTKFHDTTDAPTWCTSLRAKNLSTL